MLDVDDTDWGGPETITLIDPPSGSYRYWVHNFSGPPATLGGADAVVRVIFGDRVAGEYRVPKDITSLVWLPFKAVVVDALEMRVVPFTTEELAAGRHVTEPAEQVEQEVDAAARAEGPQSGCSGAEVMTLVVVGAIAIGVLIKALLRRGRARR